MIGNVNSQWQTDSKNPSYIHDLLRERENAKQNVTEKGEKTERKAWSAILQREEKAVSYFEQEYFREFNVRNRAQKRS